MPKITLFFFLLLPYLLWGQKKYMVVEGTVTDVSHHALPYATIQNITTNEGVNTDVAGHYLFNTTLPATFKVSFIGYKTAIKKFSAEAGKDTLQADFDLEVDSSQIGPVEITATNESVLIKESGSLIDFDLSNGKLLLLNKHSHGDQITIYDTAMHKSTTTQLNCHVEKLLRNEQSYIYFPHGDSLYFLYYEQLTGTLESFSLSQKYVNSFEPVKAFNSPYYYYWKTLGPNAGVVYWSFNSKTSQEKIFYSYFDNKILRENTDAYEDIMKLENTIQTLSTASGSNSAMRPFLGSLRNVSSLIITLYSQINVVNDSIYIFNFNNDTFNVYDNQNNFKQRLPMLFDQKKLAISKKEIVTDDNQKDCYFKYELKGITYLQKIDLNSGKPLRLQVLKYPFIEKLRIFERYAYYTYSDAQNNQMFVRHLYRQKIN